jgi:glycosyltransferase involved in cell wall biosynthesis
MQDRVSILITCYNYQAFLPEAINSALNQSVKPFEVIVADDGSSDGSVDEARAFGDRVKVLALPHRGVGAARNEALAASSGDFVVLMDADDALDPYLVEKTLAAWHAAPEPKPAFVYTQRASMEDGRQDSRFPSFDLHLLKLKNYIMISALIRGDIVRSVGFDPAFDRGFSDYDMFLSVVARGHHGLLLDEPLLKVRKHASNLTQTRGLPKIQWHLMQHILDKHSDFYNSEEREALRQQRRAYVCRAVPFLRRQNRSFSGRLEDWVYLMKAHAGWRDLFVQSFYLFFPGLYRKWALKP